MKALTVCPTYGRLPYLPRMLASFLSQDYDDKHLVIINDDINITLKCNYENVTVINCNKRITVANKRNIGISIGYHDIVFPLDDDDIFLPARISNHIKQYEDPTVQAYRNDMAYTIYGGVFSYSVGSHNDLSYRKTLWRSIGGYRSENHGDEDLVFYNSIPHVTRVTNSEESDFIYNFSGLNYHASCHTKEQISQVAFDQLSNMKLIGTDYWIEPDFTEYYKFIDLVRIYKLLNDPLHIIHLENGKLDISHLYV